MHKLSITYDTRTKSLDDAQSLDVALFVFTFNFQTSQHINLVFSLLTLKIWFSCYDDFLQKALLNSFALWVLDLNQIEHFKLFQTNYKEMRHDWTEAESFDICFSVIFDRHCLFYFWKEASAQGSISTQFWPFSSIS